jgi:toxin ParE1/3/4
MLVVWTETALDGVALACDYIAKFDPRAATHVADTLLAEGDSLEHFPHRGRPVAGTVMRELVSHLYPYIIRYRIEGERVIILRIGHTARRPTNP